MLKNPKVFLKSADNKSTKGTNEKDTHTHGNGGITSKTADVNSKDT